MYSTAVTNSGAGAISNVVKLLQTIVTVNAMNPKKPITRLDDIFEDSESMLDMNVFIYSSI